MEKVLYRMLVPQTTQGGMNAAAIAFQTTLQGLQIYPMVVAHKEL